MSRREECERGLEEFAGARTLGLYLSAWLLCGDSHTAEDLVQETLAKVSSRKPKRRRNRSRVDGSRSKPSCWRTLRPRHPTGSAVSREEKPSWTLVSI